jgi:hypothetical protein
MAQWYYQLLGEEFGPVSEASLRQLLIDGTLCNSDLVRGETSANWILLSDASIDIATDRVTEMSELNFQFEESSATANSTPAKNRTGSAIADRPPGSSQYYYQFFGQTLGPIPLDTLIRMAEAGRLAETDLVRAEEDFLWQAASEFSELSAAFLLRMPDEPVLPAIEPQAAATPIVPPTPVAPAPPIHVTAAAGTATPVVPPAAIAATSAPAGGTPAKPPSELVSETDRHTQSATSAKPGRGRGRKKNRQSEEKLVENILSEVFADDEDEKDAETGSGSSGSSRQATAEQPSPSSSIAAPAPAAAPVTAGPRAWGSVGSPPQLSTTAAAAAAAKPVLRATPKSKSSRSGPWLPNIQLEFNGPVKALIGLGLIAALWFGYTPLMRYFKTDEARYISRMEQAIETCEKLNPMTDEARFKGQQEAMKREFGAYVALMTEAGSTRESAKNCLGALNRMLEFSRVESVNSTLQKKLLDEAKLLIKKYKGV